MRWILAVILVVFLVGCAKSPTNPHVLPDAPSADCDVAGLWSSEAMNVTIVPDGRAFLTTDLFARGNITKVSDTKYVLAINASKYTLRLSDDCGVLYDSNVKFYKVS